MRPLSIAAAAPLAFAMAFGGAAARAAPADDPVFGDFKRICLDTRADPAAAEAAAKAAGFAVAPPEQAAKFHGPPNGVVLVKGGAPEGVSVGSDRIPAGGSSYPVHVCSFVIGASAPDAVQASADWAGVAGVAMGQDKTPAYMFSGAAGAHRSAVGLPNAKIIELYKAGDIQLLEVGAGGGVTVLLYVAATPS